MKEFPHATGCLYLQYMLYFGSVSSTMLSVSFFVVKAMKLVEANPVYSKDDELLSMDKEDALMVFEAHIRTLEEVRRPREAEQWVLVYCAAV